jgi:hypothetical protein
MYIIILVSYLLDFAEFITWPFSYGTSKQNEPVEWNFV